MFKSIEDIEFEYSFRTYSNSLYLEALSNSDEEDSM